ncbi:MAG: TMEM143 family protein [Actinomycetota bacterium]|nr:TMEM143 family protein [Actinomycetota bacterium]
MTATANRARENFIPLRRREVVDLLVDDPALDPTDRDRFRALCDLLAATIHHAFGERLDGLKQAYAPFDPDTDTRATVAREDVDRDDARRRLVDGLTELLERANYERIDARTLDKALEAESLLKVKLHADPDEFSEALFFRRGAAEHTEELSSLFGLRKRTLRFIAYERVLVFISFQEREWFEARDRDLEDLRFEPGSTLLKLFRNVPEADLEMLFPNSEVRMRPIDKLAVGIPAAGTGLFLLVTKLLAPIAFLVSLVLVWLGVRDGDPQVDQGQVLLLAGAVGGLAAWMWKQWVSFKTRKVEFMQRVTDDLYFKNLANDVAALHYLVDAAEDEEVKEAILAAWACVVVGRPATLDELDQRMEAWLAGHGCADVDFEVDDAVGKLERLGLVGHVGDGRYEMVPLDGALAMLDARWDGLFDHPPPATDAGSTT